MMADAMGDPFLFLTMYETSTQNQITRITGGY